MRLRITILILFIANISFAQFTAGIRVMSGGNIPFIINNMDKYTNGMTSPVTTTLNLKWDDTTDTKNWHLEIKSDAPSIDNENGDSLPLATIELSSVDGGSVAPATTYNANVALTAIDQNLVAGGPEGAYGDNIVVITYKIPAGILIDNPVGIYTIGVLLTLSAE